MLKFSEGNGNNAETIAIIPSFFYSKVKIRLRNNEEGIH